MLVKCITWLKFFYFCVFNSLECLLLLFWSCSLFPFITYYYTTSFSFFSRCFKVNFSREFYLIHLHTSYTESTTCKSDSFRKEKRDENKKKQKKLSDFHNDDVLVLYDERLLYSKQIGTCHAKNVKKAVFLQPLESSKKNFVLIYILLFLIACYHKM